MKQLAAWYQKKISSYDKEEWETMVEQLLMRGTYRRRIVDFSTHARSYLIDVDLVRGSSFPKAKPTLGMRRVVWFALVRLLFLPALYQWWAQQTSPACAKFLLTLWILQLLNMTIYLVSPEGLNVDPNSWLVPLGLMLVLSVVHSQIVSTTEMEVARVRPRSTYHRKLPRYLRRPRSDCDGGSGGGSGESGATSSQSKAPSTKSTKFRRRPTRSDPVENGLRKRKKDLNKENVKIKNVEAPIKTKPLIKVKAKDSDDEDYMVWKKPDSAPIVTFTPPPDDAIPTPSRYKPNILTKKHLESFNVGQTHQINIVRAIFAEGDDGFESLNGNNSNASDNDNKLKTDPQTANNQVSDNEDEDCTVKLGTDDTATDSKETKNDEIFVTNDTKKDDDDKSEQDSDGAVPMSSPGSAKRVGVRFRGSWIQDNVDSSDEIFGNIKKKQKKLVNYQTSSSDGECSASAPSIALPSHHTMSDWVGHTTNSEESSYCSQSEGGNSDVDFHYAADSSWDPFAILDPTSDTGFYGFIHKMNSQSYFEKMLREAIEIKKHPNNFNREDGWQIPPVWDPVLHKMNSQPQQTAARPQDTISVFYVNIKCTMWERGSTLRAELSAVDISWYVVARAERAMAGDGSLWAPLLMPAAVAIIAPLVTLVQVSIEQDTRSEEEFQTLSSFMYVVSAISNYSQGSICYFFSGAYGNNIWEISTNVLSCVLRFALSGLVFFLLSVAERAYKQRFLYAKLFSHLTSARRARKSELPHFRLNTVRNIKTWLSTRSYLRRRGPQRSVDVIVSASFMLTITLLACVSAQLLRESVTLERLWLLEALVWCICLGIYLLRLLTLGTDVNRKYRGCLSAIITEQINLHLAIEQRPECKEQLTVANNVLKLAADLLKELDAPFKINGIWANHYIYTITKVVILSALSGVLSDMLGFKLKLHKIKIK